MAVARGGARICMVMHELSQPSGAQFSNARGLQATAWPCVAYAAGGCRHRAAESLRGRPCFASPVVRWHSSWNCAMVMRCEGVRRSRLSTGVLRWPRRCRSARAARRSPSHAMRRLPRMRSATCRHHERAGFLSGLRLTVQGDTHLDGGQRGMAGARQRGSRGSEDV